MTVDAFRASHGDVVLAGPMWVIVCCAHSCVTRCLAAGSIPPHGCLSDNDMPPFQLQTR